MRWPWRRKVKSDEVAAKRARIEQERRLREAQEQWPQVNQARDVLSAWVDQALRGRT